MTMKIKNIPFIGGDTAEFEFDFGTKVLGSVTECPLKMYWSIATSIVNPSNITGNVTTGWQEITTGFGTQALIDQYKNQDGKFDGPQGTNANQLAQIMIELDLTPLCNNLFGGSNSAMQAAIKGVTMDCYAKGSGQSGGNPSNGVTLGVWYNDKGVCSVKNTWARLNPYLDSINSTSDIVKIPNDNFVAAVEWKTTTVAYTPAVLIDANNKMYFIVYSVYASDGTISSEIGLDYINIKVQFARVPDVVAPIPITLPDTWSMLVKGVSPAWDNTALGKLIIQMYSFDSSGAYEIQYSNNKFNFIKWIGSTGYLCSRPSLSFDKFKVFNFLIEQTATGKRMRVLQNGSTVEKYTDTDTNKLPSNSYLTFNNHFNDMRTDVFYNSIIFMPNKVFDDDTEAEAVLRGTAQGFEEDELITDGTFQNGLTNWPSHGNGISVSPGKATFTTTGSYINQSIPVLPNNKYILDIEGNCANGVGEYTNGVYIRTFYMTKGEFTTGPHTTQIGISMYPTAAGQYVTSVSLKLKM